MEEEREGRERRKEIFKEIFRLCREKEADEKQLEKLFSNFQLSSIKSLLNNVFDENDFSSTHPFINVCFLIINLIIIVLFFNCNFN